MEGGENKEGGQSSRLEDRAFISKIRNQFADEWEELVTGEGHFSQDEFGYGNKIRHGEKVPSSHKWLHDKLVRIGQDYRLTVVEIDRLKEVFLE